MKGKTVKIFKGAHRGVGLVLIALVAAVAVAACGSSSSGSSGSSNASASTTTTGTTTGTSTTSRTGASGQFAALSSCLKSQGVTLPTGRGGAGGFRGGAGGGFRGGAPGGGAPGGGTSTTGAPPTGTSTTGTHRGFGGGGFAGGGFAGGNSKYAKAIATCRKKLGLKAPAYGAGGAGAGRPQLSSTVLAKFSACMKQHGVNLGTANTSGKGSIFSPSVEKNPKFKTAAAACQSLLRPSGSGAGGAGTSTGSNS
jgi:hypothetical protein